MQTRYSLILIVLFSSLLFSGCSLNKENQDDFTSEVSCMEACRRSSYEQGLCKWAEEDEQSGTKLGTCFIQDSFVCNVHNECNCFCYNPIAQQQQPQPIPNESSFQDQIQNSNTKQPQETQQQKDGQTEEPIKIEEDLSREITPEEEIKVLFANQYNTQINDVDLKITQSTDEYARGLVQVLDNESHKIYLNNTLFFAIKTEDGWQIIFDDKGEIPCSDLIQNNFPEIMLQECKL